MTPTLEPGQVVWCEASPRPSTLRVGDIVVLDPSKYPGRRPTPDRPDERVVRIDIGRASRWSYHVKRISALRGVAGSTSNPSVCEVLGDNLAHSGDSRHYGPIPLEAIVGRVIEVR
jgi:signal peptidase I